MRYWLDTEFNQGVSPVELISIGIVAENGAELYCVSTEFDPKTCDEWVQKNVLPENILYWPGVPEPIKGTRTEIKEAISNFINADPQVEFWGYYADYDFFLFTRFWGFMTMPKTWPLLCLDVRQYAYHLKILPMDLPPKFPLQPDHNALVDARWTKVAWQYLRELEVKRPIEHRDLRKDG